MLGAIARALTGDLLEDAFESTLDKVADRLEDAIDGSKQGGRAKSGSFAEEARRENAARGVRATQGGGFAEEARRDNAARGDRAALGGGFAAGGHTPQTTHGYETEFDRFDAPAAFEDRVPDTALAKTQIRNMVGDILNEIGGTGPRSHPAQPQDGTALGRGAAWDEDQDDAQIQAAMQPPQPTQSGPGPEQMQQVLDMMQAQGAVVRQGAQQAVHPGAVPGPVDVPPLPKTDEPATDGPVLAEPPMGDDGTLVLGEFLVPARAVDSHPEQADPLVQAVVDYVNALFEEGMFRPGEIHPVARQVHALDMYHQQLRKGGHAGFFTHAEDQAERILEDAIDALVAMRVDGVDLLARAALQWRRAHPGDVVRAVPALARLDKVFALLDTKAPLRPQLAAWIAGQPDLDVVPDREMHAALDSHVHANPERAARLPIHACQQVVAQVTDRARLGIGMFLGQSDTLDVLHFVDGDVRVTVDGQSRQAVYFEATSGSKIYVPNADGGASLYEVQFHATMAAPELGAWHSDFEADALDQAAQTARGLMAGQAIHMLAQRSGAIRTVGELTVLFAGHDPDEGDVFAAMCSDAGTPWLFEIRESGASLTDMNTDAVLVQYGRSDIRLHAKTHDVAQIR